jgi:NAD(P)-dependent dehydrogenase (short-subunit alcohol dehydrogenase family)
MELKGRHIVVTGGASGIGLGLAERFAKEGARGIVIADRNGEKAQEAAERVGGLAVEADLSQESGVLRVITAAEEAYGPIDLYCSNAGVGRPIGGEEVPDDGWQLHWNLHVMSHVWAARALLPGMLARGEGYLLNTASAAGLLMTAGAAPYTVSKHAAVALAESLAVQHAGKGVGFSCLCPAYVETPIVAAVGDTAVGRSIRGDNREMSVAEVAEIVVEALREERFLILTHPEVTKATTLRAQDPEAYLRAMTKRWAAVNES